MFYPRVVAFDRLRGRFEMFAPCGVAAGMIARCDESWPVWSAVEGDDAILRPGLRPAWTVSNSDRSRLINAGINLLQSVRIAPKFAASPRTLASGSAAVSDWRYLSARRLALFVMTSIERGDPLAAVRALYQIYRKTGARRGQRAFLESLYAEGAFVGQFSRRGELPRSATSASSNIETLLRAARSNGPMASAPPSPASTTPSPSSPTA
jgi:phage tail sheath protein FI